MHSALSINFLLCRGILFAQNNFKGILETHKDNGNPKIKGSVTYDSNEQTYFFKAGGYNIWFKRIAFVSNLK
jgi:hypothetical protein